MQQTLTGRSRVCGGRGARGRRGSGRVLAAALLDDRGCRLSASASTCRGSILARASRWVADGAFGRSSPRADACAHRRRRVQPSPTWCRSPFPPPACSCRRARTSRASTSTAASARALTARSPSGITPAELASVLAASGATEPPAQARQTSARARLGGAAAELRRRAPATVVLLRDPRERVVREQRAQRGAAVTRARAATRRIARAILCAGPAGRGVARVRRGTRRLPGRSR